MNFALRDQYGDVLSASMLGHLIEFESQSNDKPLEVTPITTGGIPIYQTVWNGVGGDMRFARVNGVFQQVFSDLMAVYFSSGIIPQMTLQTQVRNRDGSVDTYMHVGFQFSKPRFGSFSATREVDLRVGWMSSTMVSKTGIGSALTALIAAS